MSDSSWIDSGPALAGALASEDSFVLADAGAGTGSTAMPAEVVRVSDAAELAAALAAARGGETILLDPGNYGGLELGRDFASPVTLASADPGDPAVFGRMHLRDAGNVVIEDVVFDYTFGTGDTLYDKPFEVEGGHDITFRRTLFTGDDARDMDAASDGYPSGIGLELSGTRNVTVEDSVIEGFWKATRFIDSDGIIFRGNEIRDIRSDGINLVEVRNVLIEDNHIHDFRIAPESGDHRDLIQAWTRGTDEVSENITIRGNLFDIGDGGVTQSIYFDYDDDKPHLPYRNVTIEENVIVNAHIFGVEIGRTEGLVVRHNTLLQGEIAGEGAEDTALRKPQIRIDGRSSDVTISDNAVDAVKGFEGQDDWQVENNVHIQRHDPHAAGYYGDNFIAAMTDTTNAPGNIQVLPGSPLDLSGAGAAMLAYDSTPDSLTALVRTMPAATLNTIRFDAGFSAGPDGPAAETGAVFAWDFGDGTTGTGVAPEHSYAAPGHYTARLRVTGPDGTQSETHVDITIAGPDLIDFDAARGVLVGSHAGATTDLVAGAPVATLEDGSHALVLGERDIDIDAGQIDGLPGASGFSIDMSLRMEGGAAGAGAVMVLPNSLAVRVSDLGEITVNMQPQGTSNWVGVTTGGARLIDGKWHDIGIDWDGTSGQLQITVDGVLRGTGTITGEMKQADGWPLTLGAPWGEAFDGQLRGLDIDAAPASWAFPEAPAGLDEIEKDALLDAPDPGLTVAFGDLLHDAETGTGFSLAGGEFLDLGRLKEFEDSQRLDVEVTFRRTESEPDDRGVLVGSHRNIWVELVDDRIKVSLATADGGMQREFTGRLGLHDTDLHRLALSVDADADIARAVLDGATIWELDGVDLQLAGGREWGWNVGDRWKDRPADLEITDLEITDPDPLPAEDDLPLA